MYLEMWRTARRNNPMMMQHQYSRMNSSSKFDTYIATTINLQLHSFISNILECSLLVCVLVYALLLLPVAVLHMHYKTYFLFLISTTI